LRFHILHKDVTPTFILASFKLDVIRIWNQITQSRKLFKGCLGRGVQDVGLADIKAK
jgi:hypothetical protein